MKSLLHYILFMLGAATVAAQTTALTNRYLISARYAAANAGVGGPIAQQVFLDSLPHLPVPPEEWAIHNDGLRTNTAVLNLTPNEFQQLKQQHREYIVEPDQILILQEIAPPDPPPTGWALQQLLATLPTGLPIAPGCSPCQVTLYVVDTGVQKMIGTNVHAQFGAGSPVVWGAGLLTPSLIGTGASPFIDVHNHGTGVASTAVGKDTGLFAHLHGGSVLLESCQIYFPSVSPALGPWMSDALNVIFQASEQQATRRADSNLMNDAGVLLFANRTNLGYSEIMERQLAEAAKVGLVIVSSAGNAASNSDPELPTTTVPVSNGCGPPVMISTITPATTIRTPSGLPISRTLADLFTPCITYATPPAEYLLMVGATSPGNILWPNTNFGTATHLFAPGDAVTRANATTNALGTGSGTSFSAGYVAGLALYYLSFRPWASIPEVRNYVLSKVDLTLTKPPSTKTGMVLRNMNLTNLASPGCCLSYASWVKFKALVGPASDKLADADVDGLPNIVEWALNNDPTRCDTNRGLSVVRHDGNVYLQLSRAPWDLCDATISVEASLDLIKWTQPVPPFVVLPSLDPCANNRVSEALIPEAGLKKFYRVRVNAP